MIFFVLIFNKFFLLKYHFLLSSELNFLFFIFSKFIIKQLDILNFKNFFYLTHFFINIIHLITNLKQNLRKYELHFKMSFYIVKY